MGRLASVGRCVAVVVYGLAVIAATAYAWDYVVDRSRFADYLQGARDIAYDERRGRLVVSALHADSVAVLDARGEDIALSGLYVDHERLGNAHGFAYDADRELVRRRGGAPLMGGRLKCTCAWSTLLRPWAEQTNVSSCRPS